MSLFSKLLESSWKYTDLKTRIITPVILVLGLMTALTGYSFYQSERSRLLEELNLRGQVVTASLSAYATNAMTPDRKSELENHIKAFIEDKNLLYQVVIYHKQMPYLTVTSGLARQKLLPETLKHYALPVFASDGKTEIGVIETTLSTQDIDNYLELRVVQIILICALVVIACLVLLSILLTRVVVNPLERLTHKIQAIAVGRINDRVFSLSDDEIGHLFRDINHLRVRFKRKESEFIESLMNRRKYCNIDTQETPCSALVVDDDDTVRMIAQKLLQTHHIAVTSAVNGEQALDILGKQNFDIILLDLVMGEISGFDVLERLKDIPNYKNAPVIVVSSVTNKDSIVEAFNRGAADFVIKPFNHDELMARINIHMSRYLSEKDMNSIIEQEIDSLRS